ncbi:hypothetical protein [Echinicola shivajiensis]|uniref:hypothetical protein n=1 Tax=Echinicola shivajiensis TaxID=1035916 RepID=UPI001BFC2F67|nr:hypothetical protein [Echinicola shivajiensis]
MKAIILQVVTLALLISCNTPNYKEKLFAQLVDMRSLPNQLVKVTVIKDYEIAYQDKNTFSDRYNYPNNYAIGKLNTQKNDYEYVTHINGISPIEEFDYISTILETFKTDTTYISVILKEKNIIKANIYRKTNHSKPMFRMWKWVKTSYREIAFETLEMMNQHQFKN